MLATGERRGRDTDRTCGNALAGRELQPSDAQPEHLQPKLPG